MAPKAAGSAAKTAKLCPADDYMYTYLLSWLQRTGVWLLLPQTREAYMTQRALATRLGLHHGYSSTSTITPTVVMMKRVALLLTSTLWLAVVAVQATDYYVSNSGNDTHTGTSPDTAWLTLARAGMVELQKGDCILLERNSTWLNDPLVIHTDAAMISIASYGAASLPRPHILLNRGVSQHSTAVGVTAPGPVTIQELKIGGGAAGIEVVVPEGQSLTTVTITQCFFHDIQTPYAVCFSRNHVLKPCYGGLTLTLML